MSKFIYTSINPCHFSLTIGESIQAVSLFQGETYELPEDNKTVMRMIAQKLLKPVCITPKIKDNGKFSSRH